MSVLRSIRLSLLCLRLGHFSPNWKGIKLFKQQKKTNKPTKKKKREKKKKKKKSVFQCIRWCRYNITETLSKSDIS